MSLPIFTKQNPWDKPCQSIWPLSCFSLKRNLKREPFPHRQEALKAKNTLETLQEIVKKCPLTQELKAIELHQLSPDEKEACFSQQFLEISSYEDRPSQALFCNLSKTILVAINLDNHLCLQVIDYHNDWFGLWNKLVEIDNYFAKQLDYAFSTRFGYLTKNIDDCGLGLNIKACLHLPILSSNKTEFSKILENLGVSEAQLSKHSHFDVFELKNRYNLGFTEEVLIHNLQEKAQVLIEKERELRQQIDTKQIENLKKSISTSLGILLYGRYLNPHEIQQALSYIKLGIDLKWIEGISDEKINYLFFQRPFKDFEALYKESLKNLSLIF